MKYLSTLLFYLLPFLAVVAQCPNNNTFLMSYSPICDGVAHNVTTCIYGGQYVEVNVASGNVYTISTCGNNAFDSQITIFNSAGGGELAHNDDGCGLQSTLIWTASFSGVLRVLVDQYPCAASTACLPLNITCVANVIPPVSNACLSPVPDNCSIACDLDSLPSPAPCSNQNTQNGGLAIFNMSNIGATAENPYTHVASCTASAADVWYRFTATGTQLVMSIAAGTSPSLHHPNVSLYNGDNCNALLPIACFADTGTSLAATYSPLTPGDVYYLQISGADTSDQGNFVLNIRNNYECSNCLLAQDLTVNPPPANGTYQPGTNVRFSFTVLNYNQGAANWLHGVVLSFGSGWNMSTPIAIIIPGIRIYNSAMSLPGFEKKARSPA